MRTTTKESLGIPQKEERDVDKMSTLENQPRHRASSVPDIARLMSATGQSRSVAMEHLIQTLKRQREEDNNMNELIKLVMSKSGTLSKLLRENVNTKVEIENEVKELARVASTLSSKMKEIKTPSKREGSNLLKAEDHIAKVVWANLRDIEIKVEIERGFKERYPNLSQINGDYEAIEKTATTSSGVVISEQKIIIANQGHEEQQLWEILLKIKN